MTLAVAADLIDRLAYAEAIQDPASLRVMQPFRDRIIDRLNDQTSPDGYLPVKAAALVLHCHPSTIRRRIARKVLDAEKRPYLERWVVPVQGQALTLRQAARQLQMSRYGILKQRDQLGAQKVLAPIEEFYRWEIPLEALVLATPLPPPRTEPSLAASGDTRSLPPLPASPAVPEPLPRAGVLSAWTLWMTMCDHLRIQTAHGVFDTWIQPLEPVDLDNGVLTLGAQSPEHEHHVRSRLSSLLRMTARRATGDDAIDVAFSLDRKIDRQVDPLSPRDTIFLPTSLSDTDGKNVDHPLLHDCRTRLLVRNFNLSELDSYLSGVDLAVLKAVLDDNDVQREARGPRGFDVASVRAEVRRRGGDHTWNARQTALPFAEADGGPRALTRAKRRPRRQAAPDDRQHSSEAG